jgi:hypothetical protein
MQWAPKDGIDTASCIKDLFGRSCYEGDKRFEKMVRRNPPWEGGANQNDFFHVDCQGKTCFSEKEAKATSNYIAKIALDERVKKCIQVSPGWYLVSHYAMYFTQVFIHTTIE